MHQSDLLSWLCVWWLLTTSISCALYLLHWCCSSSGHLTSPYEDEEEFDDITVEHPGDRIGDAGLEDPENIQTDWSKIYRVENKVDSEISAVAANFLKRRKQMKKNNRVTFQDNSTPQSQTQTVFVELNPEALLLESKLDSALNEKDGEYKGEGGELEREDCPLETETSECEDIESDEFDVENVKSKWSNM